MCVVCAVCGSAARPRVRSAPDVLDGTRTQLVSSVRARRRLHAPHQTEADDPPRPQAAKVTLFSFLSSLSTLLLSTLHHSPPFFAFSLLLEVLEVHGYNSLP